jgi:hypothetical protein
MRPSPSLALKLAEDQDAQRQNSIWIDIDTEENLVVLRSEADALISIAVSRHPEGWANS